MIVAEPPKIEDCPIYGLDNEWPDSVFICEHLPTKRFGCYCHLNVHGLACFSTNAGIQSFIKFIDLGDLRVVECTFDEALDVAKQRPSPVTCAMLLDNMNDPKFQFVK